MSDRYYRLVRRERGIARWGVQNDRTKDVIWCLTRWGAVRWIEMNSADHIRQVVAR